MTNCIFCKIVNKELPSTVEYEDETTLAFADINPAAETHILIIPKEHRETARDMTEQDEKMMGHLLFVAKKIADKKGLKGYQLHINVGKDGGQMVMHVHVHLLAGKQKRSYSEL